MCEEGSIPDRLSLVRTASGRGMVMVMCFWKTNDQSGPYGLTQEGRPQNSHVCSKASSDRRGVCSLVLALPWCLNESLKLLELGKFTPMEYLPGVSSSQGSL